MHRSGSSSSQAPAGDPPPCGVPQSEPLHVPVQWVAFLGYTFDLSPGRGAIARVFSHRAGWNRYPQRARSTPGNRFALCLSWNRARLPLRGLRFFVATAAPRNKCSAAREAREKGEPARTAEGWGSIALIAARARDRSREWRLRNGERLENENTSVPAVEIRQVQPTQARVVSVCRLRRNQAGRAARVGESWPLLPALLGTAAIAW